MSLDISRIQALCFDVDGTLRDTDDRWAQKLEKILHPIRFFFPGQNVHPFARWVIMGIETPGNLIYYFLDRLGFDDEIALLFNRISKRDSRYPRHFLLVPQTKETLVDLEKHFPMSVVSARGKEGTMAFLEQCDLSKLFKSIATSQTCDYTKPFPDPIFWAAEQMGVKADACLMIGDTTVDIKAGRSAGAQTVGVLCGFGTEKELRRAGADLILESPADLVDLFVGDQSSSNTT